MRLTPGALILRFRQRFGHGLRVAWWRDVVRPKILRAAPVPGTVDPFAEMHVLTSESDWLNLVWTLKSFYRVAPRRYRLVIHEDGSLGEEARGHLERMFPDARMIRREAADAEVLGALADNPRCRALRETNALSLKVFDFSHYLESDRMILMDSDILFYAKPEVLIARIEDPSYRLNSVNGDVSSAYTVDPAVVRDRMGFDMVEGYNSGLGLIHRDSMRLDWIEEFLGLPGIIGHFWRIEQTLYALFSSRFGCELLPSAYDVYLTPGIGDRPSRHYVGAIRHLMYGEGMRRLARETDILKPE